ncbi:MAG: hypothetical protein K9J16_18335 [Melioribacteraceae bacterium]|nr:hypothetical protein [Melioribacteraceae bacterium]MCF8356847.1 hypothetical protein [Melioribacteraceae bacterium]MCF8396226.1 hypothetical protein [Melioribacteraceae bacterium]MCF8421149.1 hypothetical protein [Melioribacteraceae bacterium]
MFLFLIIMSISVSAQDMNFFEPRTEVGAYGELHLNSVKPENAQTKSNLDFHRFVVFLSHSFSEKWSFKSEVELEHNFVNDGQGELELEQAYVNYHYANYFGLQFGVVLPSVGLLNEFHEPPLFLSVERPDYHSKIIPTTWFGNGAAVYGYYEGFDYKLTVMEGLDGNKFDYSSGIRSGRMKGYKSDASRMLYNARVDYIGFSGLRAGASFSYNNAKTDSVSIPLSLIEFHAQYKANNLVLVFEYGNISYGEGDLKASRGFYGDIGYDVGKLAGWESQLIPFFRYTQYNTAADTEQGGSIEEVYSYAKWMIGVSFLPLENIVFKMDYSINSRELDDFKTSQFNLGVGYMF